MNQTGHGLSQTQTPSTTTQELEQGPTHDIDEEHRDDDHGLSKEQRNIHPSRNVPNPFLPGGKAWQRSVSAVASNGNPRRNTPMPQWIQEWEEDWERASDTNAQR